MKAIHKENGGTNWTRREGLNASTGEYIAFVDSDDYLDSNAYETAIKVLEENDCDMVQFGYYRVDMDGSVIAEHRLKPAAVENSHEAFKYFMYIIPENSVLAWDKVYRRNLFENLEWPQLTYHEDFCMNTQIYTKVKKIMVIEDILYYYVKNPWSVSEPPRDDRPKICNDLKAMKFLVDFTAKAMPDCLPEMLYYAIGSSLGVINAYLSRDYSDIRDLYDICLENIRTNYKRMKELLNAQGRKDLRIKGIKAMHLSRKQLLHIWLSTHCHKLYRIYLRTRLKIHALTGI